MNLEFLRRIGLSEGEIKIYRVLLEVGAAPMSRIHEKTGIERRNIYDILNKLIEKGFVTYVTENRKRFFHLAHPNKIIGYIEEKRDELEKIEDDVRNEISSIIQKFEFAKPEINAEIFRGNEGIKAVWEDMLNHEELYWIGSGRYIPKKFPRFFAGWDKRRVKLKIKMFNIMRSELRNETKQLKLEYVRFLPKEFSGNPTVICVYGNKTVNFLYGEDFFAFVIESRELAENYRRYHRYLWEKVAKP